MLTQELAKVNLEFLARVDLKGIEAPALMKLVEVLTAIAGPAQEVTAPPNA